jgi:hypothetical protein
MAYSIQILEKIFSNKKSDPASDSYPYIRTNVFDIENLLFPLFKVIALYKYYNSSFNLYDLGGGKGLTLAYLHQCYFSSIKKVINVELDEECINFCNVVFPNIEVLKQDIRKVSIETPSIVYVYNPFQAFEEEFLFEKNLLKKLPINSIVIFNEYTITYLKHKNTNKVDIYSSNTFIEQLNGWEFLGRYDRFSIIRKVK